MKYRLWKSVCTICYMILLFTALGIWEGRSQETGSREDAVQEMKEEKMKIALTFDDGPHPSCTPLLLDGLKERGVKVTFFVIGLNVELRSALTDSQCRKQQNHITNCANRLP